LIHYRDRARLACRYLASLCSHRCEFWFIAIALTHCPLTMMFLQPGASLVNCCCFRSCELSIHYHNRACLAFRLASLYSHRCEFRFIAVTLPHYPLTTMLCRCELSLRRPCCHHHASLRIFAWESIRFPLFKGWWWSSIPRPSHLVSLLSPRDSPLSMSTSTTQDDPSTPSSRKRAGSNALQLGPRKKPYVTLLIFEPLVSLPYICSTSQDPLVHHGRHFGRTVHAFCNVQMLIANGLQFMYDEPDDESLTIAYVAYCHHLSNF